MHAVSRSEPCAMRPRRIQVLDYVWSLVPGDRSGALSIETENSSFIITLRISSEITMSLGVGL